MTVKDHRRHMLSVILVGCIATLMLTGIAGIAAFSGKTATWTTPVPIYSDTSLGGVHLASGADERLYALTWVYSSGPVLLFTSDNMGANWSDGIDVFGYGIWNGYPGICSYQTEGNDCLLVCSSNKVVRSSNGGGTFESLTNLPIPNGSYWWRYPSIGTNSSWLGNSADSDIYVVGSLYVGVPYSGAHVVSFTKSTDNGLTWSDPVHLHASSYDGIWPTILSDGSRLYVLYTTLATDMYGDLCLRFSDDWGASWSEEIVIDEKDDEVGDGLVIAGGFQYLGKHRASLTFSETAHTDVSPDRSLSVGRYGVLNLNNLKFIEQGSVTGYDWRIDFTFDGEFLDNGILAVAWQMFPSALELWPQIMFTTCSDSGF